MCGRTVLACKHLKIARRKIGGVAVWVLSFGGKSSSKMLTVCMGDAGDKSPRIWSRETLMQIVLLGVLSGIKRSVLWPLKYAKIPFYDAPLFSF